MQYNYRQAEQGTLKQKEREKPNVRTKVNTLKKKKIVSSLSMIIPLIAVVLLCGSREKKRKRGKRKNRKNER